MNKRMVRKNSNTYIPPPQNKDETETITATFVKKNQTAYRKMSGCLRNISNGERGSPFASFVMTYRSSPNGSPRTGPATTKPATTQKTIAPIGNHRPDRRCTHPIAIKVVISNPTAMNHSVANPEPENTVTKGVKKIDPLSRVRHAKLSGIPKPHSVATETP